MKTVLLVVLTALSTQPLFAQPLTADELLEMSTCDKYSCILKKAEPRGYEVALNKETGGYNVYTFHSKQTYINESNPKLVGPYRLTFTERPGDSSVAINYTVGNKEQRATLIAAFENEGYEYQHATKTESVYDNVATVYVSAKHPDTRLKVTNYEKTFEKKKYLEYEFELMRMTNYREKKDMKDNPLKIH